MKHLYTTILSSLLLATTVASANESFTLCKQDRRNARAVDYTGTRPTGGGVQLGFLIGEGLKPSDRVLEIGCGALASAIPIMSFLETGHYFAIEPNRWLIDASLNIRENRNVFNSRSPTIINNLNFDATSLGISFDYIFAHSIMSHAAHWQLPQFMENCSKVLKEGGKVIFSLRLTQPNPYGNSGSPEETKSPNWVYPGVSFFHLDTVMREGAKWYSKVEHRKDFTRRLTDDMKGVCHDWIVMTK